MQNPTPSVALVPRASGPALDAYTPRDFGEAMTMARTFAASKILGAYGTPEQVMLVMATGAELGIPPTAALRGLYVVEGRIFMSSDLMVALCIRSPHCERFDLTEQSDTAAAYTVKRKGDREQTFRFSIEDAKRAQLGGEDGKGGMKASSNWMKYPGTMCRHRAAAIAARAIFPDVIMGLYEKGEQEEITGQASRDAAPPVERIPSAPVEAEIVEADEPRIVRLLGEAPGMDAVKSVIAEAERIWPTSRPEAVKAAYKQAKQRIADAATAVMTGRQPGEEG